MGYLLPIQPIQSQQYANRMNMEAYSFTYIDRVNRIQRELNDSDTPPKTFYDAFLRDDDEEIGREKAAIAAPLPYRGFIYPNPANLSPAISQAVGKGLNINAYA
ncbi:hypothetical protein MKY34_20255 [Sporosarcina sp. FSL K6-1522]|uniref:hypothetical protein n=1 Tax=Sporosarcina sp. FSL K6-1522 TaxID=2921554 RepID=UPI003159F4B4